MDFRQATDIATRVLTLREIGEALGVEWVRQARVNPEKRGYRPPPKGWEGKLAALVRRRATELNKLAENLERGNV